MELYYLGLFLIPFCFISRIVRRYRKAWNVIRDCGFPVVQSQNWLLGSLELMKSHTAHWELCKLTRKYGRTYGLMQGSYPTVVTSDPKIIHEICIKQFNLFHSRIIDPSGSHPDTAYEVHEFAARGERWKRIRSLTSKAVSSENLRQLFVVIKDSVKRFIMDLEEEIIDSKALELHPYFQRLTFDVISRCCMGRPYSCQRADPNLKLLLKKFSPLKSFHSSYLLTWCIPDLNWISSMYSKLCTYFRSAPHLDNDPIASYTNHLYRVVSMDTVDQGRSSFLYFMKRMEDNEWNDWAVDADGPCDVSSIKIIQKLTRGEIVNQCRFLSSAGFDTTANTLTYLTYLLANNPEIQDKLCQEILTLDEITFDNIQNLDYLNCAIMETLRLFPHASLLQSRVCAQQCKIGPYTFKEGVGVIFDTWTLHYDHEIWGNDVKEFRPDRFLNCTAVQKRSWMAFGAGPRQCIGMRFAFIEIKTIICSLLKKFRFRKSENTCQVHLSLREMGTVWPDFAEVILEKRIAEYLS